MLLSIMTTVPFHVTILFQTYTVQHSIVQKVTAHVPDEFRCSFSLLVSTLWLSGCESTANISENIFAV
jgi:hypothetical protein